MEAMQQWYDSAAYREIRKLRQRSAAVDIIFINSL